MSAFLRRLRGQDGPERDSSPLAFQDWVNYFTYNGQQYPFVPGTSLKQEYETPPSDFNGYIQQLYKTNGIVFACMAARQRIFSQARFQFQRLTDGTPGDLFGSKLLAPIEHPWGPSSTTGDLLGRMIQDADLAGNAFIARLPGGRLTHMRPDWVVIVGGSKTSADRHPNWQLDAEIVGYVYYPGGPNSGDDPIGLLPRDVAHFAPHPDPNARFLGMSWLTPIIREVMGDNATTQHKLMFFENGATPQIVASTSENVTPENFEKFVELFTDQNEGVANAYKTLFFGGGANIQVVGGNLQQLDFKVTQAAGEVRIAMAAGVPPVITGMIAGIENSSYQDYGQARRAFADGTLSHLWQEAAGALETLVDMQRLPNFKPGTVRLWTDDRHIRFLKADVKEDADVQQVKAATINTLIMAGYEPDAATHAVESADLSMLIGHHTGLVSVQMHTPGEDPAQLPAPTSNGKGNGKPALPPGK